MILAEVTADMSVAEPLPPAMMVGHPSGHGRLGEALVLATAAARDEPSGEGRWALGDALLEGHFLNGSFQDALNQAEELLDDPSTPSQIRGRFLATRAIMKGHRLRLDEAEFLARRAIACSDDLGTEVRARSALCWINLARARLQAALDEGRWAAALAQRAPTDTNCSFPWMYEALASLAVDDFAMAERCIAGGRDGAEHAGLVEGVGLAAQVDGQLKLYSGDFAGALAESASAIGRVGDTGNLQPGLAASARAVIALVRIHQGALVDARHHVLLAAKLAAELDIRSVQQHVVLAQAQLWSAEGRPPDAMALLDGLYRNPSLWVVPLVTDPTTVPMLARLARDVGVPGQAQGLISFTEGLAASNRCARSLRAAALHARGLIRNGIGLLLEAVSLFSDGPRRFATSTAREDAARCLAARDETDRATELYRGALEGYVASGATQATRRVRSYLRRSGVNRLPAQRRGRPDYGWASLSESELQVVQLVAEGLTNREVGERLFMSRHTVDSHLRHVFVKLGVASRVALTRLVIDQLEVAARPLIADV